MANFFESLPVGTNYVIWNNNLHINSCLPAETVSKILEQFGEEKILETTSSSVHQGVGGKN